MRRDSDVTEVDYSQLSNSTPVNGKDFASFVTPRHGDAPLWDHAGDADAVRKEKTFRTRP